MYAGMICNPSAAPAALQSKWKGNDFMDNQTNFDPEIFEVYNVHGYADIIGTVHLLIDDVAVGLGFVKAEEKISTRKGGFSTTSGRKIYTSIRWARINKYLRDFGCLGKDYPDVKSGDYIPEQWFYFLAMKDNNEAAKKFQYKVAYEIMPAIRKNGYYSIVKETAPVATPAPAPVVEQPTDNYRVYLFLLSDGNVKIGCTKRFIPRAGEVECDTGLKIVDLYFTPEMSYKNAHLIEWCCKKKLAPNHVKGEIYSVALAEARKTIFHFTRMTFTTLPTKSINLIADKQI